VVLAWKACGKAVQETARCGYLKKISHLEPPAGGLDAGNTLTRLEPFYSSIECLKTASLAVQAKRYADLSGNR
jgi:hypothetical protein